VKRLTLSSYREKRSRLYVKDALKKLIEAEKALNGALDLLQAVNHLKAPELHCKIVDLREIREILQEEE
jgi:hypothetical protein